MRTEIYSTIAKSKEDNNSEEECYQDGYMGLAMAIVIAASKSYRSSYKCNGNNSSECKSIEKFFKDGYITGFFNMNLSSILEDIRKEVDQEKRDKLLQSYKKESRG